MMAAKTSLLLLSALACTALSITSKADESSDFYRGKTIRLISAYPAGGNSALYGDVLRKHMGKYMPGNPQIIVQSMPGGAGITAANYMVQKAPRDGTEFAMTSRTAPFEPLYDNDKARYNVKELGWLGSANVEQSVCIANSDQEVQSLDMAKQRELIVAGSSPDALDTMLPAITNQILGTRFKVVGGYNSSGEMFLSMQRHEVNGFCGVSWASIKMRYPDLLSQKKIKILFQFGPEKSSDLPDVPLVQDLAKNEIDRQVYKLLLAPQQMGRPFFTAPGVPEARLAALRKAFADTLADADFQAEAQKAGLEIQYVSAQKAEKVLTEAYSSSRPAIDRIKQLLNYK